MATRDPAQEILNGGGTFVRITNEQVWLKLLDVERQVTRLNTKLYSFAGALVIVVTFLGLTGGITVG